MQITTDPVTGVACSVVADAAGAAMTPRDKAIAPAAKSFLITDGIFLPPILRMIDLPAHKSVFAGRDTRTRQGTIKFG
ncbi:MAG: hypothetical protein HOQ36_10060 [Nocardia sp.]|nr:hypothetical protein [Nocardia sp.]